MTHYIGLDAHSKTCTAVVLTETGKISAATIFGRTPAQLIRYVWDFHAACLTCARSSRHLINRKKLYAMTFSKASSRTPSMPRRIIRSKS